MKPRSTEVGRPRRRAVITGMGAATAAGAGVAALWEAASQGRSCGRRIEKFDTSRNRSRVAATVPKESLEQAALAPEQRQRWDAVTAFAVQAAQEAWTASGPAGASAERRGICFGSAIGGVERTELEYGSVVRAAPESDEGRFPSLEHSDLPPEALWRYVCHSTAAELAALFGARGPSVTISTGCTSGADVIGWALDEIRAGEADLIVVCAADAPVTPICLSAFDAIRALTTHNDRPQAASRPFDATRNGFLLAEGAGCVILEELEHARRRQANCLAEVLGYGTNCNAFHMTSMHESGEMLARSIDLALGDAGLSPAAIDYINAHGSSTPQNDRAETAAYRTVFGSLAGDVPISSTKSVIGHPLGAAGILELIVCVMAMIRSWVPPTANLEQVSPDCDLDYVARHGRSRRLRRVLSTASGFGGLHSSLVVGCLR